ncbi:hypothetical protein D3C81_1269710 [compost metagenome]
MGGIPGFDEAGDFAVLQASSLELLAFQLTLDDLRPVLPGLAVAALPTLRADAQDHDDRQQHEREQQRQNRDPAGDDQYR